LIAQDEFSAQLESDEQHSDHQLGIDRGPLSMAVERRQLATPKGLRGYQ
jgi:hypothetical protein